MHTVANLSSSVFCSGDPQSLESHYLSATYPLPSTTGRMVAMNNLADRPDGPASGLVPSEKYSSSSHCMRSVFLLPDLFSTQQLFGYNKTLLDLIFSSLTSILSIVNQ